MGRQSSRFLALIGLFLMLSGCGVLLAQSDLHPASDLLPGETIILSKGANLNVRPSAYGRVSLFTGIGGTVTGVGDIEAIGGQVHLTNYRLVFKSHALNRITGKVSLFLPTIISIKDTSALVIQKVTVTNNLGEFDIVTRGIPAFIQAVEQARAALTQADIIKLQALTKQYYETGGEGLR